MAWTFYNASGEALTSFGPVALTDLDIDGGAAIGEAVVGADLFIADNGAGGTNVKVTATEIATFIGTDTDTRSGVAKAFVHYVSAGTIVTGSYNITSTAKNSTGNYTVTWATDFSGEYTIVGGPETSGNRTITSSGPGTGSTTMLSFTADSGAAVDSDTHIIAFGAQ